MKIKVYDGTKQDRHLCPTCKHSQIIKGQRDNEQTTICRISSRRPRTIKFRVADCTGYLEKDDKNLNAMRQTATYMERLASGKWVGLHIGQLNDYHFMNALRAADADGRKRDYEGEAKTLLAAAAKGD